MKESKYGEMMGYKCKWGPENVTSGSLTDSRGTWGPSAGHTLSWRPSNGHRKHADDAVHGAVFPPHSTATCMQRCVEEHDSLYIKFKFSPIRMKSWTDLAAFWSSNEFMWSKFVLPNSCLGWKRLFRELCHAKPPTIHAGVPVAGVGRV